MPTQQRLPLSFTPEVELQLMREAFERLPAAARAKGFEVALQNGAMAIGLRRMAEAAALKYRTRHTKKRGEKQRG